MQVVPLSRPLPEPEWVPPPIPERPAVEEPPADVKPTDALRMWLLADRKRLDLTAKDILMQYPVDVSVTYVNKIKKALKEG